MKLFIAIIFLIGVIMGTLIYRLVVALKIIKQLRTDRNELIEEKATQSDQLAKQSDQLRQKGIETELLKRELKKYSNVEIKVELTSREKGMLLNALGMPHYQSLVQNPKTEYFIREIYRNLKEKIKQSIKE